MKQVLLFIIVLIATENTRANDSLFIVTNKKEFKKGDTVSIDCYLKYTERELAAVTLNVWIEDINKTKLWKYRYPVLNGSASFDIIIDKNLPDGKYAFNFLIQKQFFNLTGQVRDYYSKMKGLTMMMLSKNKDNYINFINPDEKGNFNVGRIAFADTARFIFSPTGKKRGDLFIDIKTPLDSAFTPYLSQTEFITVGTPNYIKADTVKKYSFDDKRFTTGFTLEEVVVVGTKKKLVEKFEDEVVSGLFKGDGRVFDGLDDAELASSADVFSYLNGRVPGLQIMADNVGGYKITRRGANVDVYVDEFKLDPDNMSYINPADVAMIKVFDPLSGPNSAGGGSIAIYTKRGNYTQNSNRKNNFKIVGYTPVDITWK